MSWVWFDLCRAPPDDSVLASAPAWTKDGRSAGALCAWAAEREQPTPSATKVDARAVDGSGGDGWVSLVLAPPGVFLPFDDPAVAQATRMVLGMPPADVFSTLVEGDDRCRGALTGMHEEPGRLGYDPFANLFPVVVLGVGPGLLGRMPAPVGPSTQRYGGANPWPWDRF
jgi:hypothetical protein